MNFRRIGGVSIAVRIILITLLAVAVPAIGLLATSAYLNQAVTRDIERQADTTLQLAMQVHQSIIEGRLQALFGSASAFAANDALARVASGEETDTKTLDRLGQSLRGHADIFLIVDQNGRTRYRYGGSAGDRISFGGLVEAVLAQGRTLSSPVRVSAADLTQERAEVRQQVVVNVAADANHELAGSQLTDALALAAAAPLRTGDGRVMGAVVVADILNNDPTIVDEVQRRSPDGTPLTATIALDGIRITTNVRRQNSVERAVGTVYSDAVMERIRQGESYQGRALVVDHWQRTIYAPLIDLNGQVIASPYVGIPEWHFDQVAGAFRTATTAGIVLGVVALILGGVLPWLLARRGVSRPLLRFAAALDAGDLMTTFTAPSRDEVGRMAESLNGLLERVRQATLRVSGAARDVARLSASLASAADQTVALAEAVAARTEGGAAIATEVREKSAQVAAGMDELTRAAEGIARGAEEQANHVDRVTAMVSEIDRSQEESLAQGEAARQAAERTFLLVREGDEALRATLEGVRRIAENADRSVALVERLGEHSRSISDITSAISEIAGQTNLLALNAAIEAARAGEQGRGFAVVAEEVRRLAERSSQATQEIGQLISTTLSLIDQTVSAMREARALAQEGVESGSEARARLDQILAASQEAAAAVDQIVRGAIAANAERVRTIAGAMENVAAVVQENTAASEEMAASAERALGSVQAISGGIGEVSAMVAEIRDQMGQVVQAQAELRQLAARLQEVSGSLAETIATLGAQSVPLQ
ncbi:methyl-accepting chemotaxis protein [Symbiobacterium thermophilum]|uniref:methyl-accepting chemotaxis protein n=1 Tax=Symbiobacterium thermophilum TaxID=2734 RepID=UPI003895BCC4